MAARSLLFKEGQILQQPPDCEPCRQEVVVTFQKNNRLYKMTLRDKIVIEDPYLTMVKAAAFAIQQGEPYMGRLTPRRTKDFLLKTSVVAK